MTRIAIVGAGHIGGNLAGLYAAAGQDVTVSLARDQDKLSALAAQIGAIATDPARAVAQAEVVLISVPWAMVDTAIEQAALAPWPGSSSSTPPTSSAGPAAASGCSTSAIPPLRPLMPLRRRRRPGSRRSTR